MFVKSLGAGQPAQIEYAAYGTGIPVTLFIHGLGGGIDDTRPLASGVGGTRVFMHQRSHGNSSDAGHGVTYEQLAADAWTVSNAVGAKQIFGVSLGSAVLLRMLAQSPAAFDAVGVYLPAAVTAPRPPSPVRAILESGQSQQQIMDDLSNLTAMDLPAARRERSDARAWVRTRVKRLLRPGIRQLLDVVCTESPVNSAAELAAVTAPAVVIGAAGDPTHFVSTAVELHQALPQSKLTIFADSAPLWTARTELRAAITDVLGPE
ncbi:MAG: alpha/beta hydrolase [Antricoccus sp.]